MLSWLIAQTPTPDPADIYGPYGALVLLLIACGWLVRDHLRADKEDRDQRDQALRLVEGLVEPVKELAAAAKESAKRHRADDEAR